MLQPSGCRPLPSFSPLLGLVPSVASVLPIALVALVAPVTLVACDRVSEPASIGAVPLDAAYLTFVLIPPPGDEDEARWLVGRRFELTGTSLRFSESGPGYRTSGLIQPDLTVACVVDPERQLEQSFGHLRSENSLAPFVIAPSWTYSARANERARVEVHLERGVDVHGVVVDSRGEPVQGAWVCAETPAARQDWLEYRLDRCTSTDARGRFELTAVALPVEVVRAGDGTETHFELRESVADRPSKPADPTAHAPQDE